MIIHRRIVTVFVCLMAFANSGIVEAEDGGWAEKTIAEAMTAAPPEVADSATVLGWTSDGKLEVARYGSGPYTCIASGSFSLRIGKPALPYPDPMCLDQNAWSFLQAVWAKAGGAEVTLPVAPGLIWMLAGMNVSKNAVDVGAAVLDVAKTDVKLEDADIVQMTPHIMIMPLPFSEAEASMTTAYNLSDPFASWIMAAGKPHEHLMVHFDAQNTNAMMAHQK